jgi:hypothetical protein
MALSVGVRTSALPPLLEGELATRSRRNLNRGNPSNARRVMLQ